MIAAAARVVSVWRLNEVSLSNLSVQGEKGSNHSFENEVRSLVESYSDKTVMTKKSLIGAIAHFTQILYCVRLDCVLVE